MVSKIDEGSQIINMCWNGRNVQMKNGQVLLLVYFPFFEIWNSDCSNIWLISRNFYRNSFVFLFIFLGVFLFIFLGIGLGWLLWESLRSFLRSLFLIANKGSSMMQQGQYHAKRLSFMDTISMYPFSTHVTQNWRVSILNFATAYFTRIFWEIWVC